MPGDHLDILGVLLKDAQTLKVVVLLNFPDPDTLVARAGRKQGPAIGPGY